MMRPAGDGRPNFEALGMDTYNAPPAGQTFGELCDEYEASPAFGRLKEHTRKGYRVSLTRLRLVFGGVRADALTTAEIQHYIDQRASAKPASAKYDAAVMGVVYSAAVRRGAVAANPVRDAKPPTCPPRDRYVDDAELAAFRRHCDARMDAYVALKLSIGARQSQIIDLRWQAWNGRELTIAGSKKGRTVRYHGAALEAALDGCAKAFHGASLAAPPAPHLPIIATRDGRRYANGAHSFMKKWQTFMRRHLAAGGTHFVEHDLRAKVASDSESLELAQQRLGHQTSQITQSVYRRKPVRVAAAETAASGRQMDIFESAARKPPAKAGRKPKTEKREKHGEGRRQKASD